MIVSVTRDDLRDEFIMADEAFALSPISARATQPREEDYDAIREAFMETSRGRWFLGEYAKRNRNSDTRMVLDAVARIEETLAAQKQPAPDNGLAEALIAIRLAVDGARAAASAAFDSLALEENLAPVRKGARVIREIAWRWREIGADGRICDLLDSQVGAIEGACGQISSTGSRTALSAAFDLIERRIEALGDSDTASLRDAEEAPPPAPSDEMLAAALAEVQAATATIDAETAISTPAMPAETAVTAPEAVDATAEAADVMVEAVEVTAEAVDVTAEAANVTVEAMEVMAEDMEATAEAADAHDEAVLDMIALEMAAPDPADTDTDEIQAAESPSADPEIVAQQPEPIFAPTQSPTIQPQLQPSLELSLGSTLIANGIVRRPNASGSDPLAPIRRMSQAEKIAFFS
jgi:hypothetical protein